MPSKFNSITNNDLQLYIEDDISYDKKKIIQEVENKFARSKKLTDDETRIINQLNNIRDMDVFFE